MLFGDGILFSKAGVKAVGILMGKNKKDVFQPLFCKPLLLHIFASLKDSWDVLGRLLQNCDCS